MIVRQFNDEGIRGVRSFLAAGRDDPALPVPRELLGNDQLTEIITPYLKLESRHLVTKADAASFLVRVLEPLPDKAVGENAGLWTWLSLFFFDEVCPRRGERRIIKNDYHYVFEPKNARHVYRHLLYISWRVSRIAGDHNRLFLQSSLSTLDLVTTEVMSRLFLTRIPCIFEVLDRLYWDKDRGKARAGIVDGRTTRPGDLRHRLPLRIRQLEKTYDLLSLDADQMIELLGDEFQRPSGPLPRKAETPLPSVSGHVGSEAMPRVRRPDPVVTLAQLRKWIAESLPPGSQLPWLNGQGRSDIVQVTKDGLLVGSTNRMGRYVLKWKVIESAFAHLLTNGTLSPDFVGRDGSVVCSLLARLPGAEPSREEAGVRLHREPPCPSPHVGAN